MANKPQRRVVFTLVYEGDADWVAETLKKSWLSQEHDDPAISSVQHTSFGSVSRTRVSDATRVSEEPPF